MLIFEKQGKKAEARLASPGSHPVPPRPDLAGLEAAILTTDKKPDQADQLLKKFLATDPDNMNLCLLRAQILNESLKKPQEARELLRAVAEQTDNSAPLVQLAQIEIDQKDMEAAAATIAKIRTRWNEAATGDILDGQLALKKGNAPSAREFFTER